MDDAFIMNMMTTIFNNCTVSSKTDLTLPEFERNSNRIVHWNKNIQKRDRKIHDWCNFDQIHVVFVPLFSMYCLTMPCSAAVVREGNGKYWCWQIWNHCRRNPKKSVWCILQQMEDDLWKSDSCGLDSERKKVLASSPGALACTFMDLGVFRSMGTHFPREKVIPPYFSSPSMVAISVPFPEAQNRKGTESGLEKAKKIQSSNMQTCTTLEHEEMQTSNA